MSLKGRIQDDTRNALKAGDKDRLKVLRLMTAAVKQVEIDERRDLSDADVVGILNKMVKQRRDSIAQYVQGERQDLAEVEAAEIEVIERYLPEQLADDEIERLIDEAISQSGAASVRDMGKVMGIVKAKAAGRADMGAVGARVKARLG